MYILSLQLKKVNKKEKQRILNFCVVNRGKTAEPAVALCLWEICKMLKLAQRQAYQLTIYN